MYSNVAFEQCNDVIHICIASYICMVQLKGNVSLGCDFLRMRVQFILLS